MAVSNKQQDEKIFSTPASGLLRYRRLMIVAAHLLVWALALLLSFLFTNSMQVKAAWLFQQYPYFLVYFISVKLVIFGIFKQYRGWWRYVGIADLIALSSSSFVSTLTITIFWYSAVNMHAMSNIINQIPLFDESIFILDLFLTIMLLGALRMSVRLYHEEFRTQKGKSIKKLLIVGAGNAGEALLREIHRMQVEEYNVVGFIDDDITKKGILIHGISVLGSVRELPEVCDKLGVEEIAIAMPSVKQQQLRRVVQICQGTKIRFRTVPSITDIASGKLRVSQIRDVDISDLLGRKEVQLDLDIIKDFLNNKVIMVTGAGGSIGSEMCRQVCNFGPELLLLVEQAENPLFEIDNELKRKFPDVQTKAVICDITDSVRVDNIFEQFKPEVVIHAAAHKHVPLMETNPGEGIKNNIIGSMTVAKAAGKFKASNFVMISTDKAVNPTSLMGSSKRIAEMFVQDFNSNSETHYVTVRFGNVLGSNGSVIPIFKKQIEAGGPVTVTHPEMQRYFMTIPEASQLVLQAATMGHGGEIFVLDMGEPVKIVDLARELITLSGFKPGEEIEIQFSGMRPGEKLFEELSIEGEDMQTTRHPKIGIWKNKIMVREKLYSNIEELIRVAQTQDHDLIVEHIKKLIPEYIGDQKQVAKT